MWRICRNDRGPSFRWDVGGIIQLHPSDVPTHGLSDHHFRKK
jgi:hypothetical protein